MIDRRAMAVLAIAAFAFIALEYHPAKTEPARETAVACGTAALLDFTKANTALLESAAAYPVMSVEATLAQRRLVEQYCLRSTRCLVGDPGDPSAAVPYSLEFASCLREEAAPGQ